MQFRTTLLPMLAAVAVAQNTTTTSDSLPDLVEQLPQCAMACFKSGAKDIGCAVTDFDCLCGSKKQDFISKITPCVAFGAGCSSEDLKVAADVAPQICTAVHNNPSPAAVSSASALVDEAARETGTSAAGRPEVGFGFLGLAALAAAAM